MGEFEAELEEYISQRRKGSLMSFIASKKVETKKEPEEKKGIFSKMFGEKPKPQDIKADLKDVAKIAFNAMKRIPPAEVEEFKRSADYAYFKEILAKHELIK